MNKAILALIIAHFLTIAYTLLWVIDDKLPLIKANLFLDYSAMPGGIEIGWYIKYITDHITWCVTYFVFAVVSSFYNKKLFLVVSILGIYHLIDFVSFLINFNQGWLMYYILFSVMGACMIIVLMPIKEKAKIVTLE